MWVLLIGCVILGTFLSSSVASGLAFCKMRTETVFILQCCCAWEILRMLQINFKWKIGEWVWGYLTSCDHQWLLMKSDFSLDCGSQWDSRAYQLLTPFIRCPSLLPNRFRDPDFSVEHSLLSREVNACEGLHEFWGLSGQDHVMTRIYKAFHVSNGIWYRRIDMFEGANPGGPSADVSFSSPAGHTLWSVLTGGRAIDLCLNSCHTKSEENGDTFNNSVHLPWEAQMFAISYQFIQHVASSFPLPTVWFLKALCCVTKIKHICLC